MSLTQQDRSHEASPLAQPAMRVEWLWFWIALLGTAAIFVLLENPYWFRSGDGEVFLGAARNLLVGKGYSFNGQPLALVPPLWPLVLAGAMKMSTSFSFLKLLPLLSTIGFLAVNYWILLRFATPRRCAIVVLVAAMSAQVYPQAINFFSDGFFCLLACAALLLAMQINEGRDELWRIVSVMVLCAAGVAVRWAGLLWWLIIAATLLNGQFRPRINRQSICAIASGLACAITFIFLRRWLHTDPRTLDPRYDTFLAGAYPIVNAPQNWDDLRDRLTLLGGWPAGLLWDFFNDAKVVRPLVAWMGWLVLFGWVITIVRSARKAQWIWLGAFAQLLVLGFDWPHPMPRYLMPLTPLIILAAWLGFEQMIGWLSYAAWWRVLIRTGIVLFFVSMILGNIPEYGLEVWVQRTPNFRRHHEGGTYRQLIAAAKFLKAAAPGDVEIAITQRTTNHNRTLITSGPMRMFHFLCDRAIMLVPVDLSNDPDNDSVKKPLAKWAQRHNVLYYLWQPPIKLTYHYRDDGNPFHPRPFNSGDDDWRLYKLIDGKFRQITIPDAGDWPEKVPGIDDRSARPSRLGESRNQASATNLQ